MSSLAKTLCRWYCTVRGLMNSCPPISGLERPSRASLATCASCGVSTLRVLSMRLRAVTPVASSSRRTRSVNPSSPMWLNISSAERKCSRASIRLRGVALANERPRARFDAEGPVRAATSCRLREPLERVGRQLGRAAPGSRLDQLDQAPSRRSKLLLVLGRHLGRGQRFFVLAEAVAQQRVKPMCDGHGGPLPTRHGLAQGGVDQRTGLELATAKRSQPERTDAPLVIPDRRTHRLYLLP